MQAYTIYRDGIASEDLTRGVSLADAGRELVHNWLAAGPGGSNARRFEIRRTSDKRNPQTGWCFAAYLGEHWQRDGFGSFHVWSRCNRVTLAVEDAIYEQIARADAWNDAAGQGDVMADADYDAMMADKAE